LDPALVVKEQLHLIAGIETLPDLSVQALLFSALKPEA